MADQHLISVDELRAAGALDVPAAWRKSLGQERISKQRELFSDVLEEDQSRLEQPELVRRDPHRDDAAK